MTSHSERERNRRRVLTAIAAPAAAALLSLTAIASPAAANGPKFTGTADYCEKEGALCGGIVYANAGGYAVNPTVIKAMTDQPAGAPINAACAGYSDRIDADVDLGQYVLFVVPADCAYNLKIKILAGNTKDRNLFLTPGCVITAKTDGTTLQNDWHLDVEWSDEAKKKGMSGPVVDSKGNKCGSLGNM